MFNTGTTTFMLISTSLVMLMTPGLAFFYGGLAGRKNILGIMMQTFVSLGITTVMWIGVGYSLSFSGGEGGIIGNLDHVFLRGIAIDGAFGQQGQQFPEYIFIAYQMMFAIITPALITGAFVNRVSFKGYLIFLVLWQLFVYYPFTHINNRSQRCKTCCGVNHDTTCKIKNAPFGHNSTAPNHVNKGIVDKQLP